MSTPIRTLAQIGGLARAAQYDGRQVTQAARDRFRSSFLEGHHCKVCPGIEIPVDLPSPERERRAEALRKLHYARAAMASTRARRARTASS